MRVLLDERNCIVAISSVIEYGVWGNVGDLASWKVSPTSFIMDNNYTVMEIAGIPAYVKPKLYRYENGEFVIDDDCPNEYKERITALEEQLADTEALLIESYETQEEFRISTENALVEISQLMEG